MRRPSFLLVATLSIAALATVVGRRGSAQPSPIDARRGDSLGTLTGVYYGTELRSQLDFRTNGYTYRTIAYTFRFGPGGRVVRDLPGGAGGIGTFALRRGANGGDSVAIIWPDGTTAAFAYDAGRGMLSRGALRLTRVVSPVGYRLDGTYGTQSFANLSLGAGLPQTGVGAAHQITFRPDGRFTMAGQVGVATSSTQGSGAASNGAMRDGTYRVGDYALELAFADGTRGAIPFWVDAGEAQRAAPAWIVLNGVVWLRRSGAP